jgi:hypothetical protein
MFLPHLFHWFEVHTGTVNESGPYYGFFSGFGSDLGEIALIGGIVTLFRHGNCGQKGCWRWGRHDYAMDGISHKLCRKHHPHHSGKAVTGEEIAAHAAANPRP